MHKKVLWICNPMMILGFGYVIDVTKHTEDEIDYSKYLGPEWKKNKFKGKRVSTIISNHIGFVEVLMYASIMRTPAFTPAHFVKKFPIGHHYCAAIQCIYVNRTEGKEQLDKAVQGFIDRQKLIENSDLDYGPLCVFAEGSVTNGLNLSNFRRGGFVGNMAVQPCLMKYDYKGKVHPDYSTLRGVDAGFLMISEFVLNTIRTHTYPVFVPNDYLYNEYAKTLPGHENMEKW